MLKLSGPSTLQPVRYVYKILKSKFCQCPDTKVVELSVGKVRGRQQRGIYGDLFYSFEGIPYGIPPLGDLRFKAPLPACPWTGKVLDCQQEAARPVQVNPTSHQVIGNEDCLYLNVYTKHFDESKSLLPVMVYIYGGAFRTGGATQQKYGPDYLMREEIVYVLLNYRLCALGFLSLSNPELEVPGNAGLRDQLLALQWIKDHITCFNGDVENVTIFGESAGAASVHFMMCLPQAQGLFHKAIMMSGSMLSPWVSAPEPRTLFCHLALQAGYEGKVTEEDVLEYLRMVPAEKLVQHKMYKEYEYCFGHLHPFVPVVEESNSNDSLVNQSYLQLMRTAWSSEVPLLLGGTSFEGLIMYPYCKMSNGYVLSMLKNHPHLVLPYELYKALPDEELDCLAAEVIRFHFGPRNIDQHSILQLLDLFSYKLFWHGLHRVVLSRLMYALAPTYLYRFDFDSPFFNFVRNGVCGDDIKKGVCHADDMGYVFRKQQACKLASDTPEFRTIHRMVSILTSFARTGNPNCSDAAPDKWLPVTQKQPCRALNISHKIEFRTQPEKEGLDVWNKLYFKDLI